MRLVGFGGGGAGLLRGGLLVGRRFGLGDVDVEHLLPAHADGIAGLEGDLLLADLLAVDGRAVGAVVDDGPLVFAEDQFAMLARGERDFDDDVVAGVAAEGDVRLLERPGAAGVDALQQCDRDRSHGPRQQ